MSDAICPKSIDQSIMFTRLFYTRMPTLAGASTRNIEVVTLQNRVRHLVCSFKRVSSASEVAIFGFGPAKREGQRLMAQS